ncbi:MAG: transcriptional regulator [Firmicutes bacterium]|nr:transcriptional regulator [Bacillota bacterium]
MAVAFRAKRVRETRLVYSRLQRLHQLLSSGRCPTLADLARELEVSTRTVERDLQQLRGYCAPVIYDRARRGYRYERPFQLPQFNISAGELAILLIGQRLLAEMAGTPFADAARTVIAKLPAMLGEQVSFDPNTFISDEISFGVPAVRGDEGRLARHFNRLAEAIAHQRTVRLRYYAASKDTTSEREVDPYHLRLTDGAWYLIGHCHLRNELRIFAVDRILELTVTDRTFKRPADFSIDTYLSLSWGIERGPERTVRVAFDAEQARWIRERVWHQGQRLTETGDGGVILEVRVSGLESIKRWILSFGSHARVLEPAELAEAVRREAEGILSRGHPRGIAKGQED